MNLSKAKIKYLNSFSLKKNRDKESVFIAEGVKLVGDLLPYFKLKTIVATQEWLLQNRVEADEIIDIEDISEMKKISQLTTPSPVFALFYRQNIDLDIDDEYKNVLRFLEYDIRTRLVYRNIDISPFAIINKISVEECISSICSLLESTSVNSQYYYLACFKVLSLYSGKYSAAKSTFSTRKLFPFR